jgi:hypothetical protein
VATPGEPNLGGTAGFFGGGGSERRPQAAKLGAKVSVEGVQSLVREMKNLLSVLRDVRKEYAEINKLSGKSGTAGAAIPEASAATSKFGTMVSGFQNQTMGGSAFGGGLLGGLGGSGMGGNIFRAGLGGGNRGLIAGGLALAGGGYLFNKGMNRMDEVMMSSAGISARNTLISSMYGIPYNQIETGLYNRLGSFAGTREQASAAGSIAAGYGQTGRQIMNFMQTTANVVQASGGTMSSNQAAASAGNFVDAGVMRRAMAMGVTPGRVGGQVRNPLTVAQDYIKNYERRMNVKLNQIDFTNMQSPGSPTRFNFQRLYGLSDEAMDMVVQAGMQTLQAGGNLDYNNPADLARIGLDRNRLGLQMTAYSSAVGRRDARFFQKQEGSMVNRLGTEITIQETLSKVEDSFGGVIGKLYEFERVIQAVTVGLGVMGGIGMLGGLGGGGGAGAIGSVVGATAGGRGLFGAIGRAGPLGGGALAGVGGFVGAAGIVGGTMVANRSSFGALSVPISGLMTGGGAALLGASGPLAVGIGAGMATYAAYKYFQSVDKKNLAKGYNAGASMTDEELLASIPDYRRDINGNNAGAKQRGRFDAYARRRGALVAAALQSANDQRLYGAQGQKDIQDFINFYGSDAVFDDSKWFKNRDKVWPYLLQLRDGPIWKEYFGDNKDPLGFQPIHTQQNISLVQSASGVSSEEKSTSESTGPAPNPNSGSSQQQPGDPYQPGADSRNSATGPTWDKLDNRMKQRLLQLFSASGGKLWLGNGWRSESEQRTMFLSRYKPDPSGEISWNGQRWKHVSGPAAAPPGRSMHEIGMAADLVGDMGWLQANASRFGLKTFANVNNEPWHVQLSELPNSRAEFEKSGGSTDSGGSSVPTEGAPSGGGAAGFAGAVMANARSGVGFSLVDAMKQGSTSAGGISMAAGTGASTTAGSTAGLPDSGNWPSDLMAKGAAVAKAAYAAGFRGQDLVNMVAISFRESGWNPNNWVTDSDDVGGGLWAINQLPWIKKGQTPPWTKAEIQNPTRAAQIAMEMFKQRGYAPWDYPGEPSWTYKLNFQQAAAAVHAAQVGDGTFDTGMSSSGGNVNIQVTIQSNGNVAYDAKQLATAVRPALENVMAEIQQKRSS